MKEFVKDNIVVIAIAVIMTGIAIAVSVIQSPECLIMTCVKVVKP